MAQYGRPSSTITDSDWTPSTGVDLWECVNETPASDVDYMRATGNDQTVELKFSSLTDPVSSSGHILRLRALATGSSTPEKWTVTIYQGATLIATAFSNTTVTRTNYADYSYTLTTAQADAITNYTDLRVRIVVSQAAGETIDVSFIEFETPSITPAINKTETATATDTIDIRNHINLSKTESAIGTSDTVGVFTNRLYLSVSDTSSSVTDAPIANYGIPVSVVQEITTSDVPQLYIQIDISVDDITSCTDTSGVLAESNEVSVENVSSIASVSDFEEQFYKETVYVIDFATVAFQALEELEVDISDTLSSTDEVSVSVPDIYISVDELGTVLDVASSVVPECIVTVDEVTSVVDATTLQGGDPTLSVTDTSSVTDTVLCYVTLDVSVIDTADVQDEALAITSNVSVVVSDDVLAIDSPTTTIDIVIDVFDFAVTSDIPDILSTILYLSIVDTTGVQDYVDLGGSLIVVITESESVTDYTEAITSSLVCLTSDIVAVTDYVQAYLLLEINVSDSTSSIDIVGVGIDYLSVIVSDELLVIDSAILGSNINISVIDVSDISDINAISDINILPLQVYDNVLTSETVSLYGEDIVYAQDTSQVTDNVELFLVIDINVSDSTLVIDSPTGYAELSIEVVAIVSVLEYSSALATVIYVDVGDIASLQDYADLGGSIICFATDVVDSIDTVSVSVGSPVVDVSSIVSVLDYVNTFTTLSIDVSDIASLTDSVELFQQSASELDVNTISTILVSDAVNLYEGLAILISDAVLVSDTVSIYLEIAVSVLDSTSSSDFCEVSAIIAIVMQENVAVNDSALGITSDCVVNVVYVVQVTDTTTVIVSDLGIDVADSLSATEAVLAIIGEDLWLSVEDSVSVSEFVLVSSDFNISIVEVCEVDDLCSLFFDALSVVVIDTVTVVESRVICDFWRVTKRFEVAIIREVEFTVER